MASPLRLVSSVVLGFGVAVVSLATAGAAGPPEEPRVINMASLGKTPGRRGGSLHTLMGAARDVRLMTVYGGARLVNYGPDFSIVPDIVKSFDVEEGRIFTFHLRRGHKWSDGQPFTAEDFRYMWEDVVTHEDLSKGNVNRFLLVDGEMPTFEMIDDLTVRYTWKAPNPLFLPAVAGALPLYLYQPAHYLKQFHVEYQDPAKLDAMVAEAGARDWVALQVRNARQYRFENPDLPTLQPWQVMTESPSERFVFARNPHYHRVDDNGVQLPYIDAVTIGISSSSIIPAKVGSGESDLQARYLRFDNYTFLKENADRHNYSVYLWPDGKGSEIALMPNLNASDPVWREVIRDPNFRRGLSVGIDRGEINQALYFGLVQESGNAVLPESPLYEERFAKAWAQYDPDLADQLLDEAGLDKRGSDGFRQLPDGRTVEIIVESGGESTEETDVLELVKEHWAKLGLKVFVRTSQRDNLQRRALAGDTIMSVFSGLDRGLATAAMNPEELTPVSPQQLNWPKWGQYYESAGSSGEPIDVPSVQRLAELYKQWLKARDDAERETVWKEMLGIFTDEVFTIGIISGSLQPIVVSNRLHNVPEKGVYAFEPTKFFGHYMMDSFWLDPSQ